MKYIAIFTFLFIFLLAWSSNTDACYKGPCCLAMLVIDENEGPKISGKNQQRLFWLINIKIYHAEVEVSILHVCYEDTVYI